MALPLAVGGGGGGRSAGGGGGVRADPAVRAMPPWIRWRRRRPREPAQGRRPSLQVGGRKDEQPPRPIAVAPHFLSPSGRRLGAWRFVGLGSSGPNVEEGRVPSVLGGAVHRRAAGGPELGRAWEAGRARPSQEDNAAAPARRSSGTST